MIYLIAYIVMIVICFHAYVASASDDEYGIDFFLSLFWPITLPLYMLARLDVVDRYIKWWRSKWQ